MQGKREFLGDVTKTSGDTVYASWWAQPGWDASKSGVLKHHAHHATTDEITRFRQLQDQAIADSQIDLAGSADDAESDNSEIRIKPTKL